MRTLCMTMGLLLTVAAGPMLTGCSQNPATGRMQLRVISREQEIALGEEAAPQFEQEFGGAVADPALQSYVSSVGQRVAAASARPDMPYEFTLLNSDVPNAFALPGGKIFITRGLFEKMGNEAQLAAVLGHEVAHVAAGHNIDGLQRSMGVEILSELAAQAIGGDRGQYAQVGTQIVGGMVNLNYTREAEHEADRLGTDYMVRAGYNPWGMVSLLQVLEEMEGGGGGRLEGFFRTHPWSADRVSAVRQRVEQQYPQARPADLEEGQFDQMQARLGRLPA